MDYEIYKRLEELEPNSTHTITDVDSLRRAEVLADNAITRNSIKLCSALYYNHSDLVRGIGYEYVYTKKKTDKNGYISFDVVCIRKSDGLIIAMEYDGAHHFQSVEYQPGKPSDFERQQYLDSFKEGILVDKNNSLMENCLEPKYAMIRIAVTENTKECNVMMKSRILLQKHDLAEAIMNIKAGECIEIRPTTTISRPLKYA